MNRIGIIGAMDVEVEGLKAALQDVKVTHKAGMDFYDGKIGDKEIVVVKCGIGKVNAGMCAQILSDLYQVEAVINTGIAGSLDARIDIGDIVISSDAVYHDMDATIFGYKPGEVPQIGTQAFPADEKMAQLAVKVCEEKIPEVHVFRGRVCAGDQFIAEKAVKNRIIETFGGMCTEMEGTAIAHACYLNQIPFLIIRAISDKADDSEQMEYPIFEAMAANRSFKLVEALIPML